MRSIHFVFAGAIAAATVLTAPAQARNADAQKGEEKSTRPHAVPISRRRMARGSHSPARRQASAGSRRHRTAPRRKAAIVGSVEDARAYECQL